MGADPENVFRVGDVPTMRAGNLGAQSNDRCCVRSRAVVSAHLRRVSSKISIPWLVVTGKQCLNRFAAGRVCRGCQYRAPPPHFLEKPQYVGKGYSLGWQKSMEMFVSFRAGGFLYRTLTMDMVIIFLYGSLQPRGKNSDKGLKCQLRLCAIDVER